MDVFYGDESGFCLTSAIPYGWQFPGEHVATQPRHSQRFNVLGLFNATTNELHTAAREGSVDAAFVIDTLDAWVATRTRPTVLVLDNARLHHAATFQARLQDWEDRDVHIFYLPTYSPHLNKIETLSAVACSVAPAAMEPSCRVPPLTATSKPCRRRCESTPACGRFLP